MFYLIPTKNGFGIQLWGTYDDLTTIYSVISELWNQEDFLYKKGFETRDKVISGFSYELRKAYEGSRLKRKDGHNSNEPIEYYGCQITWVHILFTLAALRYNMHTYDIKKLEMAILMLLESWLEKAMNTYDEKGAKELIPFIEGAIYPANENLYQYMRYINAEHFRLGGGKKAFRQLPNLLEQAIYFTEEYKEYAEVLKSEAKRLNCETSDLEIDDDDIDYENLKW